MKVLQINSVCGVGSTGRIATDIHKMLLEQGHESYIAYGRGEAKNCNNSIRIGNNLDVLFHVLLTRLFDLHGFGSKRATKKFIKKVKEINPDVIHLHNIHGYYINIEVLFSYLKESGKKVVWTLHDCWAFTGHCAYFDFIGCEKWKTGCSKCPQRKSYPKSVFLDNSQFNFEFKKKIFSNLNNFILVTPSNWLKETVEYSFVKSKKIEVINNGIDLKIFQRDLNTNIREKYNLGSKYIILGVANKWEKRKGLEYFISLSSYLDENSVIILIGVDSNLISKLPNNIIGIERTNNISELVEFYSVSNIFLNPTLDEVFGLVNIEALSCGLPVITFDSGGSKECINSDCGLIIKNKTIYDINLSISKIKQMNISPECCIDRASLFDKNLKFQQYINLYKE